MIGAVHIGVEKTGTTSFQAFMHHNRSEIRKQGILYPENLGGINHRLVATYGLSLETSDEFIRGLKITTEGEMAALLKTVESRLQEQIAANPTAKTCVISSEHLHSRLTNVAQIMRVKTLLEPLFDEIEIYVHLRPQVDVLASLASTQTRVGGAVRRAFFEQAKPDRLYYNYNLLVAAWEEVFGADNVYCLPFRETPDFLSFIAERIDLDLAVLPKAARINEAIDVRVMAMVNALVDSGSSERIDCRVIDKLPVEEKLEIDLTYARKIQHRFEESNRMLIERRKDLSSGQLQPKWMRYSETGNMDILEHGCSFGAAFSNLLVFYNNLISDQKNEQNT